MTPSIAQIAALPVATLRSLLPAWVASQAVTSPEGQAALHATLQARVDATSDADLTALLATFAVAGDAYRFYPAVPFARGMTRAYMRALTPTWRVDGLDRLDAWANSGPARRMIVCNHLSYTDTQLTDSLLCIEGRHAVADKLVAIAGPKVYTDAWRRMAAISLNTRKTAQSSAVATEQGSLGPRELAAVALETLQDCARLMDEGWIILLYPEGTRSRTGRLQPFLRAAGRYLQLEGLQVLPMAQTGSDRVFPLDSPRMHVAHVDIAFGEPFASADFPGKQGALTEAHGRMARLLPAAYRPDDETAAVS
jgi:1-acyl-sn-glycerol-3-phosphate acyltransferase